jgi:ubiquinone/menaquinone biosynthesis C-methylase UbiE
MAGDYDYESYGHGYATQRTTDSQIAAIVHAALGSARTVLNVGAGTGSYEPEDRYVLAVEPSHTMRAQRPRDRAPAIDATAEHLPFNDDAFDASMAILTIHQWDSPEQGIRELRRVTHGPVVVLTFDRDALEGFWLGDYLPDLIAHARKRYPTVDSIREYLGGSSTIQTVPVPLECSDGFIESYYGRPERLLDSAVRQAQSSWKFIDEADETIAIAKLRHDLDSGEWDRRYGKLRSTQQYDGALRLITGH